MARSRSTTRCGARSRRSASSSTPTDRARGTPRRDLPAGTVTFVFTDVEGSTRLLDELGPPAYADALAGHRRIVREAVARHGGSEVDTQGDAFFLAFADASAAVHAATAIHEELAPSAIRIRVGIHTGAALVTDEGYVGDAVH
ncbi:MAG: adenylate/guanylate cyclase domain-containing protein, partial [Chloroflexota bacterium]